MLLGHQSFNGPGGCVGDASLSQATDEEVQQQQKGHDDDGESEGVGCG